MKPIRSDDISVGVVFVVALGAAFALSAWQGRHMPLDTSAVRDLAARHAAFVPSGGVVAEPDRSVPNATQALSRGRSTGVPEVAASTF